MKKVLLFIIPSLIVCILGLSLVSNEEYAMIEEKSPKVLFMATSVEIPSEVEFADEKISLERYDMHERFDRELNGFTYMHSSTLLLIKRANRYFPIIEPILKKNGIPEDFKYLAVIESNLDPRAVSRSGAAGLWQFMKNTAPGYGLEVSTDVDERYSVEKSTEAACKYFKQAYKKYGNWSNVALSFNAGQGRISSELNKQDSADGLDLWLVEETSRYYFRMLAIKMIFENPYKYGLVLNATQLYKPIDFKNIEVNSSIEDLYTFAKEQNISYAQLKDFNSWLRTSKLTISPKNKKTYTIQIPDQKSLYYKNGEKVKVHEKNWVKKD